MTAVADESPASLSFIICGLVAQDQRPTMALARGSLRMFWFFRRRPLPVGGSLVARGLWERARSMQVCGLLQA